jgi:hypothetical protein
MNLVRHFPPLRGSYAETLPTCQQRRRASVNFSVAALSPRDQQQKSMHVKELRLGTWRCLHDDDAEDSP